MTKYKPSLFVTLESHQGDEAQHRSVHYILPFESSVTTMTK